MKWLHSGSGFDLCVLDLNLPRLDGRDVLRRVRETTPMAGLPVLVLTVDQHERTEVQPLDEGADDYIRKPLDPARFMVRVKAALRRAAA